MKLAASTWWARNACLRLPGQRSFARSVDTRRGFARDLRQRKRRSGAGPGGSIAHELHMRPEFPSWSLRSFRLTMRGSVIMTEALYGGLLRGDDPRWVLHDVRQRLSGSDERIHDWASLVVYASFSPGIEDNVQSLRYFSARQAMFGASKENPDLSLADIRSRTSASTSSERLRIAHPSAPSAGAGKSSMRWETFAMLKRDAHHFFLLAQQAPLPRERPDGLRNSLSILKEARDAYRSGARTPFEGRGIDSTLDWLIAQWLTLDFVLGEQIDPAAFFMAYHLARVDVAKKVGETQEWAFGSLLDLDDSLRSARRKTGTSTEETLRAHLRAAFEASPSVNFHARLDAPTTLEMGRVVGP